MPQSSHSTEKGLLNVGLQEVEREVDHVTRRIDALNCNINTLVAKLKDVKAEKTKHEGMLRRLQESRERLKQYNKMSVQ